jgi:hypothetical protein
VSKIIKITVQQLRELNACQAGIDWFITNKTTSLRPLVTKLLKDDKASYARWLLARLMTHPQQIKWAIYSAEQVIKLYEDKYPDDKRPRLAIKAAKDFLAGKITKEAAYAAANAAYAAANAANAAANAAYAAANAAAYDAAYADRKKMEKKLMEYALKLLGVECESI